MKLNLCCGKRRLDGYIHVDMVKTDVTDVVHDLTKPLPYGDETIDEIICVHGFEHFYRYEADAILADWIRTLKPSGTLILELPCLDKVIRLFNHFIAKGEPVPENLTMWGLYGDQGYCAPEMVHRWCYSISELTGMMEENALKVALETPHYHQPVRDMRLVSTKFG